MATFPLVNVLKDSHTLFCFHTALEDTCCTSSDKLFVDYGVCLSSALNLSCQGFFCWQLSSE